MDRKTIIELIKVELLNSRNKEDLETLQNLKRRSDIFPWREYGEYQNLIAILAAAVKIEEPSDDLRDEIIKKARNLKKSAEPEVPSGTVTADEIKEDFSYKTENIEEEELQETDILMTGSSGGIENIKDSPDVINEETSDMTKDNEDELQELVNSESDKPNDISEIILETDSDSYEEIIEETIPDSRHTVEEDLTEKDFSQDKQGEENIIPSDNDLIEEIILEEEPIVYNIQAEDLQESDSKIPDNDTEKEKELQEIKSSSETEFQIINSGDNDAEIKADEGFNLFNKPVLFKSHSISDSGLNRSFNDLPPEDDEDITDEKIMSYSSENPAFDRQASEEISNPDREKDTVTSPEEKYNSGSHRKFNSRILAIALFAVLIIPLSIFLLSSGDSEVPETDTVRKNNEDLITKIEESKPRETEADIRENVVTETVIPAENIVENKEKQKEETSGTTKKQETNLPPPLPEMKPLEPKELQLTEKSQTELAAQTLSSEVKEPVKPPEEEKIEEPPFFVAVEEMPQPVKGISEMQSRVVYPKMALLAGVEGKVFIQAMIDENGNVVNADVLKGIGAGCDEAALSAVRETKFKPGKQRGKPVKVRISIPIIFDINGKK